MKKARRGKTRAGQWPVLVRHATDLTGEDYVRQQAWLSATLSTCPVHPRGGCALKRNGTYARKEPAGMRIQRYYCPGGQITFSLIPDCLAARVPGTLLEIESTVAAVEAGRSVEATAARLRPDVELPGAVRWTRRRMRWVAAVVRSVAGLLPDLLAGCELKVLALRSALGADCVLVRLRHLTGERLEALPAPAGLGHLDARSRSLASDRQQPMGPDPPGSSG